MKVAHGVADGSVTLAFRRWRAQDVQPGLAWEAHVENDEVVRLRERETLSFLAVCDEVDTPALFFQAALHEPAYGWIIFDYEGFHRVSQARDAED